MTGIIQDLYAKKRYSRLFDAVFLSVQQAHALQPEDGKQDSGEDLTMASVLADGATVDVESST